MLRKQYLLRGIQIRKRDLFKLWWNYNYPIIVESSPVWMGCNVRLIIKMEWPATGSSILKQKIKSNSLRWSLQAQTIKLQAIVRWERTSGHLHFIIYSCLDNKDVPFIPLTQLKMFFQWFFFPKYHQNDLQTDGNVKWKIVRPKMSLSFIWWKNLLRLFHARHQLFLELIYVTSVT